MRFKTIAILAAFCIALAVSSLATAQTTTKYLLGAKGCGPWTGDYYCDLIPFVHADGSQPNPSNGDAFTPPIPAYVWSNLLYNGQPNWFAFLTNDGLDAAGTTKNVVTLIDVPSQPAGVQLVTITLKGVGYTGTLQYQYVKGTRHCSGRTCITPWNILGGVATITVN